MRPLYRIMGLFSEQNAAEISRFFACRCVVESRGQTELDLGFLPSEYDEAFFRKANTLIAEITETLAFYNAISADMQRVHKQLTAFTGRVDEAVRFDEEHLLPIALEVFGSVPLPVTTEYVPIRKLTRSKAEALARRLYFDSYYSFVMTDFFEGLHYGHYPRRCGICKKYFLMTSARRQRYCNGIAPYEVRGKKTTCRKYAASINRKELAATDPVVDIYNRRCAAIRTEKGRKTITEEFAKTAQALAKEYKLKAQQNQEYSNRQYILDMSRERLYAETDKRLK